MLTSTGGAVDNFPRTLSGSFREVQLFGISSIYEVNLTLSFDPVHTQIANNTFQSGLQTAATIQSELAQKGY
jgi:hypothetical protein